MKKESGIKIRLARKDDLLQMIELAKINFPDYPIEMAKKELSEMFFNYLYKPTYIVAEFKGKIIGYNGFIISWVDNLIVDIFWVNTYPDYRGKGVQSKLMNETIKQIKKNSKIKIVLLSTEIPSFFKKFGFEIINKKYDNKYFLMEKRL